MRKRSLGCLMLIALLFLVFKLPVAAAQPSTRAQGPEEISHAQEFTVVLHISTANVTQITGTLQYDADKLMLVNMTALLENPWQIRWAGNRFTFTCPQNATLTDQPVLRLTFSTELTEPGVVCGVAFTQLSCQTQGRAVSMEDARWEAPVARILSAENRLQNLTVENGTMAPDFHPAQGEYTVQVAYETARLMLSITPREGTTVSVSEPELIPGVPADVVVTVTAENGNTREYILRVLRATAGSTLTALSVENFALSPAFDPEITEYTLEVPWDKEAVSVLYTTKDPAATVQILGQDRLYPGLSNRVELTVTGSDGSVSIYNLHITRAQLPESQSVPETTTAQQQPDLMWQEVAAPWWVMLLLAVGLLSLGAAFMWLYMGKRRGKRR